MKVSFEPRARTELVEAGRCYRVEAGPAVAEDFSREFRRTLASVMERPEAGATTANRCRRHLFRKYPYSLIYRLTEEGVHIVAVAHQSRRPHYWARRT